MSLKPKSRLRRILLKATLVILSVCVVSIILLSLWVELQLKDVCAAAVRQHPGDKVEALMMLLGPQEYGYRKHSYRMNNRAVWALGQLGDDRALPFLRNLLTGQPCDHNTNLCQGEITKAIQKLDKDYFNLPQSLWRSLLQS